MAGENYFLITALPSPPELGGAGAMTAGELIEHVGESTGPRSLIEAIFLADDLLQRDAFLAGELDQPTPAVLVGEQVRDEAPLPEYLAAEVGESQSGRIATDSLWSAYYRYAAGIAARTHSAFLAAWIAHEVGLRNALVEARAKALSLEPGDYLVAIDLGDPHEDFAAVVSEWSAAGDPLAGLRVLDTARWRWLDEHDAWFSFADDELAAYAARLMLLNRWRRLTAEQAPPKNSQETAPTDAAPEHATPVNQSTSEPVNQ